ncbi:MAG: SPOCS domain-containing protein [Bacillota bacterium]
MSHKLQVTKRLLRLEEVVGEAVAQAAVSQVLDIPPQKPPVASVLDSAATVAITRTTVFPGKVVVDGVVDLVTIYEALVPYQSVHVVRHQIMFTTFVEIPGVEPGMTIITIPRVESVSFEVRPGGNQIVARVVVAVLVRVIRSVQVQVVTAVTGVPGLKVTREIIRAETVLGEDTVQVIVRDIVEVPEVKPPVRAVLDHVVTATVSTTVVVPGKVIVRGVISIRIIYEAVSPYQTVHVLHATIPFERFVDVEGALPGMTVIATVRVEFVSFEVSPDGRRITVRAVLEIFAKVVRVEAIEIVTDASGVAGLKVTRIRIRIQEILGEAISQSIVREVIDIPDVKPPVASVLDTEATATVTRTIVLPRKIIVEGILTQRIVYEAAVPTQAVHVVHATFPFADFVEVPEARPGLVAGVFVRVEHISVDVTPPGDPITVQKVLAITGRVLRAREIEVVTDVTLALVLCTGTVIAARANVRTGPSTAFPVLAQVEFGTVVTVLAFENQWLQVRLPDERVGFIFSQLVRHDCLPKG